MSKVEIIIIVILALILLIAVILVALIILDLSYKVKIDKKSRRNNLVSKFIYFDDGEGNLKAIKAFDEDDEKIIITKEDIETPKIKEKEDNK